MHPSPLGSNRKSASETYSIQSRQPGGSGVSVVRYRVDNAVTIVEMDDGR
jgi:hypothetical protein